MAQPVGHFEIVGRDPTALRAYYGQLFGWEFDTSNEVAEEVSAPDDYGFVNAGEGGIPGGVGGGPDHQPRSLFYVFVPDVAEALRSAERLGGTRRLGPVRRPDGALVVAQFTDPEGNLVGLAGPA